MSNRSRTIPAICVAVTLVAGAGACSRDTAKETTPSREEIPTATAQPGETTATKAQIKLTEIATLDTPVAMSARAGTSDLYVAQQGGVIQRLVAPTSANASYEVADSPVLDISDLTMAQGERGLLGLTFSPDGELLYIDYTDRQGDSHIVEYQMKQNRADPSTARELLFVAQPYPNHNGGQLAFGPDGFLYIGFGDGGASGDPQNRAQNTQELLGKVLRIDPSRRTGSDPYAIPPGNPFADGQDGRPEIWLYGVRNPWRFSFDPATQDLWIADVGQDEWEEIDLLPAEPGGAGRGANLGWPYLEGTHPFKGTPPDGLVGPVYEYSHAGGNCSVIGGFVYRGSAIPELRGTYLFGDYCRAAVLGLRMTDGQGADVRPLGVSVAANSLSSFGQDSSGELYVLSTEGPVYKIERA